MSRMSSKVWARRKPAAGAIPGYILRDLRESLEDHQWPQDDVDALIYSWSMQEVLENWLVWNGIIGYSSQVLDIFDIMVQSGKEYADDNEQQG
jgi:hypothetical protein